jgi:hypothetical protein
MNLLPRDSAKRAKMSHCRTQALLQPALDVAAPEVGTPYTSTAKNPCSDVPTSQDILARVCTR